MFTKEELAQLGSFLLKATIQGTESVSHANLLIKIQKLLNKQDKP